METYNSDFPPQTEMFKHIFTKNRNSSQKETLLKNAMQKTELKILRFSTRSP